MGDFYCQLPERQRDKVDAWHRLPYAQQLKEGAPDLVWADFKNDVPEDWDVIEEERGFRPYVFDDVYCIWFKSRAVARAHVIALYWGRIDASGLKTEKMVIHKPELTN